jgi:hypothetical protein
MPAACPDQVLEVIGVLAAAKTSPDAMFGLHLFRP